MILAEKHGVITDDKEIADILNEYFIYITKSMWLKRHLIHVSQPLESIFHLFRHYNSIQRINLANIQNNEQFHFSKLAKAEARRILNLSSKKSSPKGDILAKILKVSIEFIINDLI